MGGGEPGQNGRDLVINHAWLGLQLGTWWKVSLKLFITSIGFNLLKKLGNNIVDIDDICRGILTYCH